MTDGGDGAIVGRRVERHDAPAERLPELRHALHGVGVGGLGRRQDHAGAREEIDPGDAVPTLLRAGHGMRSDEGERTRAEELLRGPHDGRLGASDVRDDEVVRRLARRGRAG